jgi:hypothetical protein
MLLLFEKNFLHGCVLAKPLAQIHEQLRLLLRSQESAVGLVEKKELLETLLKLWSEGDFNNGIPFYKNILKLCSAGELKTYLSDAESYLNLSGASSDHTGSPPSIAEKPH